MNHIAKIAASLSLVALCAQPGLAAAYDSNATASVKRDGADGAKSKSKAGRICANVTPDTGSRMTKKVCRTKAEWEAEGIDVKN